MRKRTLGILLAGMMALSVSACGGSTGAGNQENQGAGDTAQVAESTEDPATTESADETETPEGEEAEAQATNAADAAQNTEGNGTDTSQTAGSSDILVAYFTYGENANLGEDVDASSSASIQMLDGQVTGNTGVVAAAIAELTGADTFSIRTTEPYPDTYEETIDQGQEEQQEDARPELSGQIENLDSYDTIFLGYPN